MTELTPTEINALLEEVEERRDKFRTALDEVNADDTIDEDDYYVEICRRLAIPLSPPQIHDDGEGTEWCDVCGVRILFPNKHGRWHLRIQAATKLAYWMSELSFKHTGLLGLTLTETLRIFMDLDDDEWIPSGHGWIYLIGDPPGSVRARCGGPVMCGKCRADEQHSIAENDGAATAYYERRQEDEQTS